MDLDLRKERNWSRVGPFVPAAIRLSAMWMDIGELVHHVLVIAFSLTQILRYLQYDIGLVSNGFFEIHYCRGTVEVLMQL